MKGRLPPQNISEVVPFVEGYGYVINLSGFTKPVAIYLRYVCGPLNKFCDFLTRHGLVRSAKKFDDFDSAILKVLLRWNDRFDHKKGGGEL